MPGRARSGRLGAGQPPRVDAAPRLCFLKAVAGRSTGAGPSPMTSSCLIGWTFDAYRRGTRLSRAARSSIRPAALPTFRASPRRRRWWQVQPGGYRLVRPPFDRGRGYYGLLFAALDDQEPADGTDPDQPAVPGMPVALQQPAGLATDLLTNAALAFDLEHRRSRRRLWPPPRRKPMRRLRRKLSRAADPRRPIPGRRHRPVSRPRGCRRPMAATGSVPIGLRTASTPAEALLLGARTRPRCRPDRRREFLQGLRPGLSGRTRSSPMPSAGKSISIRTGPPVTLRSNYTLFGAMLRHPHEHFLESFNGVSLAAALRPVLASEPACAEAAAGPAQYRRRLHQGRGLEHK